MDPNENLDEQRDTTDHLRMMIEHDEHTFNEEDVEKTDRLVDLTKNLDEWIMNGGPLPAEWTLRCNGGFMKRAQLAQKVYEQALEHTATFEGELGMQLAYLMGAILKNDHLELDMANAEHVEVFEFFSIMFGSPDVPTSQVHPVWYFIQTGKAIARAS